MKSRQATTRAVALATFACIGLLATACAGTPAPDASTDVQTVAQSPTGSEPVESVTWNMGSGEPATLNPPNVPTYSGMALVSNLCDSLLSVDAEGAIIPGLTTVEMETPTRAVFTLRGERLSRRRTSSSV